jgi:photoactive yellow protein
MEKQDPLDNLKEKYPFFGNDDVADDETSEPSASEPDALQEENFGDDNLAEQLQHASRETLDRAPFGVIRVSDDGIVEFYNQFEAEFAGVEPKAAKGKNFFTEVAPCSNNRLFRQRFRKGVRRKNLDAEFSYTFTYKMKPTLVDVRLLRDDAGDNWVLVKPTGARRSN